jgi:hypothetical protein
MRKNVLTPAAIIALGVCLAFPGAAGGDASQQPEAGPPIQGTWSCETTQANAPSNAQETWTLRETDTIEALSTIWNHGTARPPGAPVPMYVAPSDANQPATAPFYDYYLGYSKNGQVYIQIGVNPTDTSMTYFVGTSSAARGQLNGSQWNIVYPIGEERGYKFSATFPDLTQVCTQKRPTLPPPPPSPSASESFSTTCRVWRTGESDPTTEDLRITTMAKYKNGQGYWWQGVATEPNPDPTSGQKKVIYEYNIFLSHGERVAIEVNDITGAYIIATTQSRNWNDSVWTVVYPTLENGFTFTHISQDQEFPQGDLLKGFELLFKDGYQICGPAH